MNSGKLTCPAEGCGYNLRSEDSIHIFQYLGMRRAALLTPYDLQWVFRSCPVTSIDAVLVAHSWTSWALLLQRRRSNITPAVAVSLKDVHRKLRFFVMSSSGSTSCVFNFWELRQCLPEDSYFKLLEFLTCDDPRIVDCRALGCEDRPNMSMWRLFLVSICFLAYPRSSCSLALPARSVSSATKEMTLQT